VKAWKAILAALVIFCAGAVTGTLLLRLYQNRPIPAPTRSVSPPGLTQRWEFLRRLSRQLDLTSQQKHHIEQIVRQGQDRVKELYDPIAPMVNEEFRKARELILSELTPKQRKHFEELSKHRGPRRSSDEVPARERKGDRQRGQTPDRPPLSGPPPARGTQHAPPQTLMPAPSSTNSP
jgi:Spy/CpxP family protein refolding chaperone